MENLWTLLVCLVAMNRNCWCYLEGYKANTENKSFWIPSFAKSDKSTAKHVHVLSADYMAVDHCQRETKPYTTNLVIASQLCRICENLIYSTLIKVKTCYLYDQFYVLVSCHKIAGKFYIKALRLSWLILTSEL